MCASYVSTLSFVMVSCFLLPENLCLDIVRYDRLSSNRAYHERDGFLGLSAPLVGVLTALEDCLASG